MRCVHDFSMIICTQFMEEHTAKPEFPSRLNVIHIHELDLSQSRFGVDYAYLGNCVREYSMTFIICTECLIVEFWLRGD